MRGRKFIANTAALTGTSLIMRLVALFFQIYLTNRIGAAGIGLYFLILSVSMFASTFAVSGVRFAATRLVSEELGRGNGAGARTAVRRCLAYSAVFGTAAAVMLFFGAEYIGTRLIGDGRTILSLRFLSLNLPFFAMGAVFSGYFTAVCRVGKLASTQFCEQVVRIGVTLLVLTGITPGDVEHSCAAIVIGSAAGEFSGFVLSAVLYMLDDRRRAGRGGNANGMTKRLLGLAPPLAVSAYVRTALSSVSNLLVPRGLRAYGTSPEAALADYGMIQGMVFPIITFPSALFVSLAELLVPELTDAQMKGQKDRIRSIVLRTLRACLLFSLAVMCVLLAAADELGMMIYDSVDVGHYVRIFAFLMPVMYLDTVTDGMLRGLGEHMYSMRVNIVDSALSVVLIAVLLPKFGVAGYVVVLYFSEMFNFGLSILKLYRILYMKKETVTPKKVRRMQGYY